MSSMEAPDGEGDVVGGVCAAEAVVSGVEQRIGEDIS